MAEAPSAKRRKVTPLPEKTLSASPSATGALHSPSSRERWTEAKANSRARMGKRNLGQKEQHAERIDIYDDIEGAHGERSPLKPSTPVRSRKSLDPLKNQSAGTTAAVDGPSKVLSAADIFKQFRTPKKAGSAVITNGNEKDDKEPTVIPAGQGQGNTAVSEPIDGKEVNNDVIMEELEDVPVRSSGRERRLPTRYSTGKELTPSRRKPFTPRNKKLTTEDANGRTKEHAHEGLEKGDISAGSITAKSKRSSVPKSTSKANRRAEKIVEPPQRQTLSSAETLMADGLLDESMDQGQQSEAEAEPLMSEDTITPRAVKTKTITSGTLGLQEASLVNQQVSGVQKILLERRRQKCPVQLSNRGEEYAKVSTLVTQTITAGESNSMLIIGARGSGKTTLINQILREQWHKHPGEFHAIRLNGFIHTDDKIALREIWRQLGRELEGQLDTEGNTNKNIADTLSTLLALLSTPVEQGRDADEGHITKSVVFVLDEFELFATHPRQTLLYNLFDIAQSRKAPIAVLGLTTRIDVAEALEKRVKSRFSHRYVHLSLAKSLVEFEEIFRAMLTLTTEDFLQDQHSQISAVDRDNMLNGWRTFLDQLFAHDAIFEHLRRIYYTTKSIPEVMNSLIIPLSIVSVDATTSVSAIVNQLTSNLALLHPPDSKLTMLASLSTLGLALLICAARLTNIHAADSVSFLQVYEEYKVLASKAKVQASAAGALAQGAAARVCSKDVARGAWQELEQLGLVMADVLSAGGNGKARVDVGLEEIGASGVDLGAWARWCKEI